MAGKRQKRQVFRYALISVSDKAGIVPLAKTLSDLDYKIISTGGTAKLLSDHGISVIPIELVTGNAESFDGRMKSISFQIESGILYDRTNATHVKEAAELGIKDIGVVICNLYPFEKTTSNPNAAIDKATESIDVGGPTMIRSAAKNFKNVLVVVTPDDYGKVGTALEANQVTQTLRKELAAKAFAHLSLYDSLIARFLGNDSFGDEVTIPGRKVLSLRYGENAHQQGTLYLSPNISSFFGNLQKLWGRELSLTNVLDMNAGLESVRVFEKPAAVVIKHNSPCGIALGDTAKEALQRAIQADPESAFGGVIAMNKPLDSMTAKVIASFKEEQRGNIDIIIAPSVTNDALKMLQTIRKSMGIYASGPLPDISEERTQIKWVDGGFLLQTTDDFSERDFGNWTMVTKKKPTKKQLVQMQIGWKFITRIRSNAVIIVDKNLPMTRGIGSGQTSRLRSTKIALAQAGQLTKDAILISDSFFPFDDSVTLASQHSIGAILQQGGSINDAASIQAAEKAGITMVFTNRRAFWH